MKCPECQKAGQKSTIQVGHSSRTLIAFTPSYDQDGNYQSNDPNRTTTHYSCSNGHQWKVTE